ncbi:aldose 1-epimerase family protein [Siculibacillus lacustris]|uniref:Aldose 1-epimerase family protein n=1 Tax=Siculibacillus lacustris TaxID=1549641 RepID=A0A4Q9VQW5_9HYPH|nr:aldose 1-epimerase family protein [Siculibacillus lacustris]TBW38242.1 aldose 1-epimerase family protein [Siculibacillus lacustris]
MSRSSQTVTLLSDELSADVALLGAELTWLDDAVGNAYLWNGDPTFWSGRAPLLFPIVGSLAGGVFRHRGRTYALPRHGFARTSVFEVVERGTAHTTLRLEASGATRAVWPFEFRLDVTHAVAGRTLTTTAEVSNTGDEDMPVAFGFHPAFHWPLPYAGPRAAHTLTFESPEPAPVRRLDAAGLLRPEALPSPVIGDTLPIDDALFADDALIFDALASRRVIWSGETGARLIVDFEGMPQLGLWSKPGAGFLCIEPWQGHADPVGFAGEIGDKPGSVTLAPGETRRFAMAVTLDFRAP